MDSVGLFSPRSAVVAAAHRAGLDVTVIEEHSPDFEPGTSGAREVVLPTFDDAQDVARRLSRLMVLPDILVGFGDVTSQLAVMLNRTFGLRNLTSFGATETFRSKDMLRAALPLTWRHLNPRTVRVDPPYDRIDAAAAEVGVPLVVKPVDGQGSHHVTLVDGAAESDVLRTVCAEAGGPVLFEEYVSGPELSVECYSWDGTHHVLGLTKKYISEPPRFIETAHVFPHPDSAELLEVVEPAVRAVLDAGGFTHGLSHSEFIVSADGLRLVESHPRPGGDRISDLVGHCLPDGPFDLLFGSLRSGLARSVGRPRGCAGVQYALLPPRAEADDRWRDAMWRIDGVVEVSVLRPHDQRAPIRRSGDRHALVVVTASDQLALRDRLTRVRTSSESIIEQGWE